MIDVTPIRGHIVRLTVCVAMALGGLTLSSSPAEAHRGPTYKQNRRNTTWRYRPNVWRGQRHHQARRWRSVPRYRRVPRRPVYQPPRPRRMVGPGRVWVPGPPPLRHYRRPRVYVVPQRPPVIVAPGRAPVQPLPPRAPEPPQPDTVRPDTAAPAPAPPEPADEGDGGAAPLPPDMDPNMPPSGATGGAPVAPPDDADGQGVADDQGGQDDHNEAGTPAPAPTAQPPVAPRTANPAPDSRLPAPDIKGVMADAQTSAIAHEVLRLVNSERAKRRLPPLSNHVRLSTAGWLHSREMYQKRYFSHESPHRGSRKFTDRIRNAGVVGHGAAGENIAMTHVSKDVAQRLVAMWMDSSGHRANILHKQFRFSGIGIFGDGDYVYATQVFTAKVKTPSLSKPMRGQPTPAVIGPTRVI